MLSRVWLLVLAFTNVMFQVLSVGDTRQYFGLIAAIYLSAYYIVCAIEDK